MKSQNPYTYSHVFVKIVFQHNKNAKFSLMVDLQLSSCRNLLTATWIPRDYIDVIKTQLMNKDVGFKLCNKFTITYFNLWNLKEKLYKIIASKHCIKY